MTLGILQSFRGRRTWRFAGAVLAAGLLTVGAVACGDDDDDDPTPTATASASASPSASASASASPTEDEPDAAFPVTIEHKYGSTTIDEEPVRVLALGYQEHDFIYALGVEPIAARYWYGDEDDVIYEWAEEAAGGHQPEILNMVELDFEQITALEPDLILGLYSGITEEDYNTLSQIAPTVTQSGDYVDYGSPWQETAVTIGRALGKEAEAQELVDGIEADFAALAAEHPEWEGLEVAVVAYGSDGTIGFFASEDPRARIFTSLGFVVPAGLDEIAGDQFYGSLSAEQAQLLDVDLLVWTQLEFVEGGAASIQADPLLSSLQVSQENRVLYIDGVLDDAFAFNSVLSLPLVIERLQPLLEAAMDGDPSTIPPVSE